MSPYSLANTIASTMGRRTGNPDLVWRVRKVSESCSTAPFGGLIGANILPDTHFGNKVSASSSHTVPLMSHQGLALLLFLLGPLSSSSLLSTFRILRQPRSPCLHPPVHPLWSARFLQMNFPESLLPAQRLSHLFTNMYPKACLTQKTQVVCFKR